MAMDPILIHRCFLFAAALLVGVSNAHGGLHFKHPTRREQACDIFRGQWIPSPSDPRDSDKCRYLYDRWNCLQNRPDRAYLHWRWKPYSCDLPLFDPDFFLNLMKNKVFAFIGDSISINQKESLLCLLSKVEEPLLVQRMIKNVHDSTWFFPSYNFTLMGRISNFLLRLDENEDPHGIPELHLDVLNDHWTGLYHTFDYVVIGCGPWFNHPSFMLENNTIIGCHRCKMTDVPELGEFYAYRRALSLAFRFILTSDHKPFVIYRIHAPQHFENGRWNTGGYCNRTTPLKESDLISNFKEDHSDQEYERISREEYAHATMASGTTHGLEKSGVRLEMLDVFHLSLLRPDGHPNIYAGHGKCDCVHWCVPGVIDTWNDLMMEMIIRELGALKDEGHVI